MAEVTPTERVRAMEGKELLEESLKAAARLCLIRNDIELEEDTCTEEEAAQDAAWACFGEGTCSEDPLPEVAELLSRLSEVEELRKQVADAEGRYNDQMRLKDEYKGFLRVAEAKLAAAEAEAERLRKQLQEAERKIGTAFVAGVNSAPSPEKEKP